MRRAAALLAAALLLSGAAGCGGDGAEPGAPKGVALVLDFTPNAAHTGLYAAQARGFYREAGLELTIRPPGESSDAPKLLEAGRVDLAILDIHDLGIARGDGPVRRPRDLEGRTVGVTGLPSDEAVVDSEVSADGGDPAQVDRVTIGFNAISSLAAGRVDAATGFWNAEGVALRRRGVPVRIFKVDRYGAPPYPELVLVASRQTVDERPETVEAMVDATTRGYEFASQHPAQALTDLLAAVPSLDRADQAAQLRALGPDLHPAPFDPQVLRQWSTWDVTHGLLRRPVDIEEAFDLRGG